MKLLRKLCEWIDHQKSETLRRALQSILGATLLAIPIGIIKEIWSNWDFIKKCSKWLWTVLQTNIETKAWVLVLAMVALLVLLVRRKKPQNTGNAGT
jgi:hypothetical protein